MNAVEALTVKSIMSIFGSHNTLQVNRVSAYDPATGVIALADAIAPSTTNGARGFAILNHPAGRRLEGQFPLDFANDQIDVFSGAAPSNQVFGGQCAGSHSAASPS